MQVADSVLYNGLSEPLPDSPEGTSRDFLWPIVNRQPAQQGEPPSVNHVLPHAAKDWVKGWQGQVDVRQASDIAVERRLRGLFQLLDLSAIQRQCPVGCLGKVGTISGSFTGMYLQARHGGSLIITTLLRTAYRPR